MNEQHSAGSTDEYYLQDKRDFVGNCVLWWRKNREGYCTDLREAHVFTRDEAYGQHDCRETDIPWPKAYIDRLSAPTVDMQKLKRAEATAS
jgi:hypothetical protein